MCVKTIQKRGMCGRGLLRGLLTAVCLMACLGMQAQQVISGVVRDAETGEAIPYASVVYKNHQVATMTGTDGRYTIRRHEGWKLTFSVVGYKSYSVPVNKRTQSQIDVYLTPTRHELSEVTVKTRRKRYSRKNNPAVELMRRVVAAKKKTDLAVNDFYRYNKYEKITLSLNDLKPEQLEKKPFKNNQWLLDQVETSEMTGKLILPLSVDETVSQKLYRRAPKTERNIIIGQKSKGVNDFFQTGDAVNTVVKDVFTDIDLYQDHIRLLQFPFISPISNEGIRFYRYYIEDTLAIERDSCIHLHFIPNNQNDMGFRGDLYILKDSTLHVRRCEMTIPNQSNVNFVENVRIQQEYDKLPDGQWVLTKDDMATEISVVSFMRTGIVTRVTRYSDYAFDSIPDKYFRGMTQELVHADAQMRDEAFWNKHRQVRLTRGEKDMGDFMKSLQKVRGMNYLIIGLKALMENAVETGEPNYADICPINTILSHNYVDGFRSRFSAMTTANLNRHFFLSGYYGRGWGSKKNYYNAELTYSLNAKKYRPHEFPRRTLTLQLTSDVMSPSDRFIDTDKDNVFVALKWSKTNMMMFYNRQLLSFDYETDWGLRTTLNAKVERNEACGIMSFRTLDQPRRTEFHKLGNGEFLHTTEVTARLRYAPGETYINSKRRRKVINRDAPIFTLSHTIGFKGVLGGDYNYNYTEAAIRKRFWLSSWGRMDFDLKGGVQWNQVPYPLLILPEANQSYIIQRTAFSLINNMEFLNDRFVSLVVSWDMNGKLFNRIPLIRHLHWREYFGFKMLWGALSDKNNPFLEQNQGSSRLMYFPEVCNVMDPQRPYYEAVLGVHNIFKFLHVEYVRRLNYNNLPTSPKRGVRFMIEFSF